MHLIVSVNASDLNKVTELTEERGYSAIHISPLNSAEREEIALVRQFGFVILLYYRYLVTLVLLSVKCLLKKPKK